MPWPMSQDYNEAIQLPGEAFADDELRGGQPILNALGLPMPRSGNFADVYEFQGASGAKWAIKCFTRQVPGRQERYAEISKHLSQVRLPFFVEFTYLPEGMRIAGEWYPILKMQWVEGLLLNEFVRNNLQYPDRLKKLIEIWLRMAQRMREAELAHGDLQHGNVILVPGIRENALSLRLVDYDGMWVPALAGRKSTEVGHPAYQHPRRIDEGTYTAQVDRLPLLAIACALQCLVRGGKRLWDMADNGDNLLFRATDLADPAHSDLFKELWKTTGSHPLVAHLIRGLDLPVDQVPLVNELMDENGPKPLKAAHEEWVSSLLEGEPDRVDHPEVEPEPSATAIPVVQEIPIRREDTVPEERRRRKEPSFVRRYAVATGFIFAVLIVVILAVAFRSRRPVPGPDSVTKLDEPKQFEPVRTSPEQPKKLVEKKPGDMSKTEILTKPPPPAVPEPKKDAQVQAAPAAQPTAIGPTDVFRAEEELTEADRSQGGKRFTVTLTKDIVYQIDLPRAAGSAFYPVMSLQFESSSGTRFWPGQSGAHKEWLLFRPPETASYQISVASRNRYLGRFTLTVRPAQGYALLLHEFQAAEQTWQAAWQKAKTPDERKQLSGLKHPSQEFDIRFLDFADKNPQDPDALEALLWLVMRSSKVGDALALVERDHGSSDKLEPFCEVLTHRYYDKKVEPFLRGLLENSPHRRMQGIACLALARLLSNQTEAWVRMRLRSPNAAGPQERSRDAEDLFERAAAKFADVGLRSGESIGALASAELYEFRFLSPGKTAPEIQGNDQNGKAFKLSDYRGKVVLLDFWGNWSGWSRSTYASNREIVEHFKGQPFALVGVNSDSSADVLKNVMKREQITWRSWFDGGESNGGPIAAQWRSVGRQRLFIIDHQGMICERWTNSRSNSSTLVRDIEPLIARADPSYNPTSPLAARRKRTAGKPIELTNQQGSGSYSGKLLLSDGAYENHSHHKLFNFFMSAGKSYQIDLQSRAFDSYLRVIDPLGRTAVDDDSGGNLDARIIYKASKSGKHRIVASSLDGKTGPFTLTIRPATPK